jgi:Fur family ferric uptake transcriptional regulator
MTVAQTGPPLKFKTLAEAIAALRNRGLRLSAARRLVLETLFAADRPLSAEEVADGLNGLLPVSDLASCYRNLEMLERLGVVRHVHMGHGPGLYALAGRGANEYLLCEHCGGYTVADPAAMGPVRDAIREAFGYEARFSHFPLMGMCPACDGAPATDAAAVLTGSA